MLFDDFEAVKCPEENLILITRDGYLYYVYDFNRKFWRKHHNAGNDYVTVNNYPDVSKEELMDALGGVFPSSETAFIRCCPLTQLDIGDYLDLLHEDYPNYMAERTISSAVRSFMLESTICHKSYLRLKDLFDNAQTLQGDCDCVLARIKDLCLAVIGRDIFREEIRIVDGHNGSSYFWIMPVRVIDFADTCDMDNVAEMGSCEISIEEDDVAQYLTPFLNKYFDGTLEANKRRVDGYWKDEDGSEHYTYIEGFEWYLTHNFYTFEAIRKILDDIKDTISALSLGQDNEYTEELRKKRGFASYELLYARDLSKEQIDQYNANRPKEDDTEINLIVDFYNRFIYRMEYMLKVGEEKGFDLISFMGP